MYSLYLYFLGLNLRNTSKALVIFRDKKRSHVSVWNWIQRFGSFQIYKRKRVAAFIVNETVIQIGSHQHFCLWFCIEPIYKSMFEIIFLGRENALAECFIESLVGKYGKHTVYTDGSTWYPSEAYNVLGSEHHYLHSPLEKSLIERVMQYFKDRTTF